MRSRKELFLHSLECCLGICFLSCENTIITLSWALKQVITQVHTLISMCVQCFWHLLASNSWHHTLFFREEFLCLTNILFTIQPKLLDLLILWQSSGKCSGIYTGCSHFRTYLYSQKAFLKLSYIPPRCQYMLPCCGRLSSHLGKHYTLNWDLQYIWLVYCLKVICYKFVS